MPVVVALLCAGGTVPRAQSASDSPPQAPVFASASTELVVLPVTVVDGHRGFVTGLSQDRFTVYDNGRRQDIAVFTGEDSPVSVALVIDDSRSMAPKMAGVVSAALAFAQSSNPHDELFALAFNDSVIDAIPGRPLSAADTPDLRRTLSQLRPDGKTALYDAVLAALARVREGTAPRRVVVVISDGGDNASDAGLRDVLAAAREADVTIYTIGLYDEDDFDRNPGVLKSLARSTGGERFVPAGIGQLNDVCRRIARDIRNGYTVAFVPPDHDGAFHQVRVDVRSADGRRLTARTRPGYVAPLPPLGDQ